MLKVIKMFIKRTFIYIEQGKQLVLRESICLYGTGKAIDFEGHLNVY